MTVLLNMFRLTHFMYMSESELLPVTRSNDNHSPGPVMRDVNP